MVAPPAPGDGGGRVDAERRADVPTLVGRKAQATMGKHAQELRLSVPRILAVVSVGKFRRLALLTPDFFPGSLGMLQKIGIPIFEV